MNTHPNAAPQHEQQPPPPVYERLEDWVTQRFVPMYRRPLGGEYRWCAQWWRHGEAISRLTVLWHTWERFRIEPLGMATWYAAHLDHHLPQLLSARGPFYQCTEKEHIEPRVAAMEAAPPGWWGLALPPRHNTGTVHADTTDDQATSPPGYPTDDEGEGP